MHRPIYKDYLHLRSKAACGPGHEQVVLEFDLLCN